MPPVHRPRFQSAAECIANAERFELWAERFAANPRLNAQFAQLAREARAMAAAIIPPETA